MRVALVTIVVDDQAVAVSFFCDVLGFEVTEDRPSFTNDGRPKRWVVVTPPGAQTGLLLAAADGPAQAEALGNQTGGRVSFFLEVDDFDSAYERMAAANVRFLEQPRSEPYGQVVVFQDVAGNKWDLLGPPKVTR
ncbi:MAG: catechol 2,3-dioxygenase-like lactoylglutathione lyase family enzyme [Candidatus Poriferisodalaceae bacterium]|jgi:catechol 2,3-dioxygenase-like lactoylglutathione lyase family enzyme